MKKGEEEERDMTAHHHLCEPACPLAHQMNDYRAKVCNSRNSSSSYSSPSSSTSETWTHKDSVKTENQMLEPQF
jgi:hypothetical protein